jgi:hypothetical protein
VVPVSRMETGGDLVSRRTDEGWVDEVSLVVMEVAGDLGRQ